ncbi:MAG: ACP S-malonyltransferase [Candidatus Omnitrophica bacterium]|nr:ACP S-malonyltransferase [Candidatus Omnitrophota bacterium]
MGSESDKMDEIRKFSAVFPGQASQYVGMGKDFIDNVPGCAGIIRLGGEITSLPLMEKIMSGPMEDLTRTLICQPAVFGISMVCWHAFGKTGLLPRCVAGHSLGEYTALAAAKVISLEDGFVLVKRRAQIMDEISESAGGGLSAVIGLKLEEVENLLKDFPGVSISNINSRSQIVVGGKKEKLEKFNVFLKSRKAKGIMLNVSGPFHTPLMEKASVLLAEEIEKINFSDPEVPVYLNYSGVKTTDKEEIKRGLIKQVCSPVRWVSTIENISADEEDGVFVEVGPKTVLKKLIEGILPCSSVFNVEDTASLDKAVKGLKSPHAPLCQRGD